MRDKRLPDFMSLMGLKITPFADYVQACAYVLSMMVKYMVKKRFVLQLIQEDLSGQVRSVFLQSF